MSLLPPASNGDPAFYRAMHFSAKCGLAIACRPSVRSSVCDVGDSWSYRLEILETNCTGNQSNTFALCSHKAIYVFPREHGEILGRLEVRGIGKSGVLENKSGNISETRKDRGKVTMDDLYIGTHKRSFERYHPDLYSIPLCGHRQGQPQFLDTEGVKLRKG